MFNEGWAAVSEREYTVARVRLATKAAAALCEPNNVFWGGHCEISNKRFEVVLL